MTTITRGVDVASGHLDARQRPEVAAWRRFANSAEGVAELAAFCKGHGVRLVAMGAAGGCEQLPLGLLWAEGVPAALVNPRQSLPRTRSGVRRSAGAMGIPEKTDRIDAGVIAWYAEARRIAARPPAGATQRRLAGLVTRLRHQLTALRVAQANQRRLAGEPEALASIDAVLALVGRQARELEGKIAGLVGDDPAWEALDAAFRSIEGVAGRTVARPLAEMPEVGTPSGKAAAELAGLAPIARDGGRHAGGRPARGGREGVRPIPVVVAGVVRRHDPDFRALHRELTEAGEPAMVVRVALARKLLVRLNAEARDARRELAEAAAA